MTTTTKYRQILFYTILGLLFATTGCSKNQNHLAKQKGEGELGLFSKKEKKSKEFSLTVAGFGIEAVPKLPVGVAHLEDGTLIFGPMNAAEAKEQSAQGGLKNVLIKPGPPPSGPIEKQTADESEAIVYSSGKVGTTQLILGKQMSHYEDVLDSFQAAEHPAHWTIVTTGHEIRWPAKLTLRADGDLNPRKWPYEFGFDGSFENLLFLQGPLTGPEQIPSPDRLVAPNQQMVEQGSLEGTINSVIWIELAYEHEGEKWRQRFYYLPIDSKSVYLMRAQATAEVADAMFKAADTIATSFRPRG